MADKPATIEVANLATLIADLQALIVTVQKLLQDLNAAPGASNNAASSTK